MIQDTICILNHISSYSLYEGILHCSSIHIVKQVQDVKLLQDQYFTNMPYYRLDKILLNVIDCNPIFRRITIVLSDIQPPL